MTQCYFISFYTTPQDDGQSNVDALYYSKDYLIKAPSLIEAQLIALINIIDDMGVYFGFDEAFETLVNANENNPNYQNLLEHVFVSYQLAACITLPRGVHHDHNTEMEVHIDLAKTQRFLADQGFYHTDTFRLWDYHGTFFSDLDIALKLQQLDPKDITPQFFAMHERLYPLNTLDLSNENHVDSVAWRSALQRFKETQLEYQLLGDNT